MVRRYLLAEDGVDTVLLIASEELSKFTDYGDRASCILFGDGSAAFVIRRKKDTLWSSYLGADGSGAGFLVARALKSENVFRKSEEDFDMGMPETKEHLLYQDGKEVYKFATKTLAAAVEKACEKAGITPDELAAIVPHQANVRIIETAAKNLGAPLEKFIVTLDHYGNTSSASIPLAFNEAVEKGIIKRGDKIAMIGFGAGLTYAGTILEY
jgi:3-oxoacyl-[acyl-carrier-protein] synthase-3